MATVIKEATAAVTRREPPRKKGTKAAPRLSRLKKPPDLSVEAWQTGLRRQFGVEQPFDYRNLGDHSVFSEFRVTNPASRSSYRAAIRGTAPGENFCSCPDFATNSLGTCKHIEFLLAELQRKRGGKKALAEGFQPAYTEVYLKYGDRREVRIKFGADCPAELARLASKFFDDEGTLLADGAGRFDEFVAKATRLDCDVRIYDDTLRYVAELRDRDRRAQLIAKAFPRGIRSAAFKHLVRATLYDYQREGVLFAARAGRCLIGDEMGLGKTIQAIGAAEVMARLFAVERVLVVCPTSLKHQWEREIERFTGRNAQVIGGLRQARERQFSEESFYKILNYDTVHRDLDFIAAWRPDLVILDEAQRIKNWATRAARSVKKIDSPYAIVLTGTPLENRLQELVSIVQFVDQHRLGPTYRLLHEHQICEGDTARVVGYRDLDRIGRTLEPILLRRRKSEVLAQLPERLEKNFFVPMTPQQMEYHAENADLVGRIVKKWKRYGFLSDVDQRLLMIALQNMRMSCNSTYLLDHETDFGVKADELVTVLDELYEREGTKTVIFSQWTRTHELLLRRFERRGWDSVFFHGGVPGPQRKGLVDRFREDGGCRAFLSTDAGGVGLNLQHASVVINMDLPWNPAVLEQRIGRVHRLGQTQPVQVVNFVSQGTIEEGMLSLLKFKKSVFAGILDAGEREVFLGGSRLKRFVETVEKVTGSLQPAVLDADEQASVEQARDEAESDGLRARTSDRSLGGVGSILPAAAAATEHVSGQGGAADQDELSAREALRGSASAAPGGSVLSHSAPSETVGERSPANDALSDSLTSLLRNGIEFLARLSRRDDELTRGHNDSTTEPETRRSGAEALVHRDGRTGRSYLQVPLPEPNVLNQLLSAVAPAVEQFAKLLRQP